MLPDADIQTHFRERALARLEDVRALFAINPSGRAVVFVHGYGGDALKSWSDFHQLLPRRPECARRDLFFYGYDGLYSELIASAGLFREFLDGLFAKSTELVNSSLPAGAHRSEF